MRVTRKFTPLDYHIAAKIKQFRLSIGMGQEQLAELTGVSFQQIQKYEAVSNRITAAKLYEISQILNKPMHNFFKDFKNEEGKYYTYKVKSQKKLQAEDAVLTKELLPLIRAFNRIENKQIKKHVVSLVREISGPFYRKKSKHLYS